MNSGPKPTTYDLPVEVAARYTPPTVTFLGTLAELTQEKEVGAADGSTFQGLDIGIS